MSTTFSQSSALIRIARPSSRMPALLTSTRTGPKRSRTSVEGALHLLGVGDVGLHVGAVARQRRDGPAAVAQALGDRRADAARAAGDERAALRHGMGALLPRHDARAPHEAGAEGRQGDDVRPGAGGPRSRPGPGASGIEADEVLAIRSTFTYRRSGGRPSSAAAASRMRELAWWATKQVDVVDGQPGALERDAAWRRPSADRVAVDLAALHLQDAGRALGVEQVGARAVGAQHEAAAGRARGRRRRRRRPRRRRRRRGRRCRGRRGR